MTAQPVEHEDPRTWTPALGRQRTADGENPLHAYPQERSGDGAYRVAGAEPELAPSRPLEIRLSMWGITS